MLSLRSLTERIEVDHNVAWVAEHALDGAGVRTYPKSVTEIEYHGDTIRVYADGKRDAEYYYDVEPDGSSEAYYVNQQTDEPELMGEIVFAELTDSDGLVKIKRGEFRDSRS